jgi:hypothetical protein
MVGEIEAMGGAEAMGGVEAMEGVEAMGGAAIDYINTQSGVSYLLDISLHMDYSYLYLAKPDI